MSHPTTSRSVNALGFPMHCVPLSAVIDMTSVEKHETLRARGLLVEYELGDPRPVVFISHQWLSVEHADPDAEQFTVLQGAIQRLLAGYEVRSGWMDSASERGDTVDDSWSTFLRNALIWYDYFCVPQDECNKHQALVAISCIPAYVHMSATIFILAPSICHKQYVDSDGAPAMCDYFTWTQRGWCRLELLAAYLKVHARPPLVILSESSMHFISAGYLTPITRVSEGEFTCCYLNHTRVCPDGTLLPLLCDKQAIFGVVRELIARRLQHELDCNNARTARQILSHSHIWLRGLLDVEAAYNTYELTLDAFFTSYGFATSDVVDEGWTPLRFACLSGNVNVARLLLEGNADVETAMHAAGDANFPVSKGTTILLHIIFLCCCLEHEEILNLLVTHKADLRPKTQMDALTAASMASSPLKRGAQWLLRRYPEWDVNTTCVEEDLFDLSRWPLYATLHVCADIEYVRLLCARNANITIRNTTVPVDAFFIACSLCPTSSPEIAKYLFHEVEHAPRKGDDGINATNPIAPARLDVNRRLSISFGSLLTLNHARVMHTGPQSFLDMMLQFNGRTVLMCAADAGKHRICKWLLKQKADASISNTNGETALSLALQRGFACVVDVLHAHELGEG